MNLLVLMFSLDQKITNHYSDVAMRISQYAQNIDILDVVVPSSQFVTIQLAHNVGIYCVGGQSRIVQLWRSYKIADDLIRNNRYTVITVQDSGYLGLLAWFLARRYHIGLEVQIHGFELSGLLRSVIARFLMHKASVVRVVSRRLAKDLIKHSNLSRDRITVIPVHVPQSTASERCMDETFSRFVTVGRLVPIKRIDLQIRAVAELRAKGIKVELVVIGDGPERQSLEARVARLNLQEAVTFVGWQNDMAHWYRDAVGLLLTSDAEGWGRVVIEAAYFQVPIIMTNVGCAGEVFKDMISALIVPTNNVKALEDAMQKLLADKELAKRLVAGASQSVASLPDLQETIAMYIASWVKASQKPL